MACFSTWAAVQRGDTFTLGNFNYQINFAASSTERAEAIITGFSSAGKSTSFSNLTLGGIITYNGEQIDVETVSSRAFEGQTNFTEVTFNYGMRDVGTYAFSGCTKLKTVHLPSSMRSLQGNAFAGCTALQVVYHALSDPTGCTFNSSAFPSNSTMLLYVPKTHPNSVEKYKAMKAWQKFMMVIKSSDACDFSLTDGAQLVVTNSASLNNVGSVTLVGFNGNASGATSGNFVPSCGTSYYNLLGYKYNITAVADSACLGNTKLKTVDLSNMNSLKKIGVAAFQHCAYLTSIKVMAGEISNFAFRYNYALTSLILREGCVTMGEKALEACDQIVGIVIPKSMTFVKSNAFDGCTKLATINVNDGNPMYRSVNGILYRTNDGVCLVRCPEGHPQVRLEEEDFYIAMTRMDDYAFYNCKNLKEIYFPYGLQIVGQSCFENCTNLAFVKIPVSVSDINSRAFYNCTSLKEMTSMSIPNLGSTVFYNCPKTKLHLLNREYMKPEWKDWGQVVDNMPYDVRRKDFVGNNGQTGYVYYRLYNKPTEVGPDRYENNATLSRADITSFPGTLKVPDVIIGPTGKEFPVINVGSGKLGVFYGEKQNIQPYEFAVELGRCVKKVSGYDDEGAFKNQTKLTRLTLNPYLERIELCAFENCRIANDLIFPYGFGTLGDKALAGNQFKRILLPSSLYVMYASSLQNCSQLSEIIVNSSDAHIANLGTTYNFDGVPSTAVVRVPTGWVNQYKSNEKWKKFNITAGAYDFCYQNNPDGTIYFMTIMSDNQQSDGKETFDGMAKYVYNPRIAASTNTVFYCSKSETDKTCGRNKRYMMVAFGDSCLYGASQIKKIDVENMSELTQIGNYAFAGTGITSLNVSSRVWKFGERAVYGCKSLTELIFNIKHTEWELGNNFYGNNGGQFYCYVPWEYYDFYRSKLPASASRPSEKAPREQLNAYLYMTMSGHKACLAVDHPVDWEKSGLKAWNVSDYDEKTLTVRATPITATPANHGVLVDWYDLNTWSVQKLYRPQSTPAAPATVLAGVNDEPLNIAPIGVWNVGYKYNPDIYGVPNNETFNHPSDAYYIKPGYAYMALDKTRVTTNSGTVIKVVYGDTPTPGVLGDVDGNGVVDITDVNILINIVLGKDSASKYAGADVDGNGEVDITDVNTTLNLVLGK